MSDHGDQNYRRAHQATIDAGFAWNENAPYEEGDLFYW